MFQVFLKKDCLTNPTGFPTEPPLQHLWEPGLQPWFVSKNLRTCFDNSPYNKDPTKVSRCVSEFLAQNTFAACVLVAPTKNLLKDNVIICHLAWNFPSFVWKKIPKEILGQILFSDCSGYQDPRAQNQKPIKNQPSWSASKWPSIRWSNPKSSICQVLGRGEKQPKHMPCQFRNMDAKKPPGKCSVPFSLVKLMKINNATDVFQALCFWTTGRWDTLKIPNPVVKHHAAKKQTSAKNKPQEAHKMMNNFFVGRWMCNINGFFSASIVLAKVFFVIFSGTN